MVNAKRLYITPSLRDVQPSFATYWPSFEALMSRVLAERTRRHIPLENGNVEESWLAQSMRMSAGGVQVIPNWYTQGGTLLSYAIRKFAEDDPSQHTSFFCFGLPCHDASYNVDISWLSP